MKLIYQRHVTGCGEPWGAGESRSGGKRQGGRASSRTQGISLEGCLPRWLTIKDAGGEEPHVGRQLLSLLTHMATAGERCAMGGV